MYKYHKYPAGRDIPQFRGNRALLHLDLESSGEKSLRPCFRRAGGRGCPFPMSGAVLLRKAYRFTASLKLTIIILSTLAAILIAATWFSGYDITVGALRRDLYGSWWFNVLLVALMANLVACTVIRKPWRFWQW